MQLISNKLCCGVSDNACTNFSSASEFFLMIYWSTEHIQILCRFWAANNNNSSSSHLYGCGQPKTEQQKASIISTDLYLLRGRAG